ncbi:conserved hypothetical protein [Leishmania major strain Friedlin]|uniref:Uncharacterized protein n=1 Tax=Leishmania major TaxID=5664 RepID=Q4QA08_LEIMA|nr:conserved hypothetical protein [Leishmania major strain Friedlin]CAG9575099.1 hypothetical_protein_-_conserved [Leishmania major strain Friedlin]CAJ04996.1 conserved hypothetical protein [Leishmania major strain Friedlin]|eukprot:XP_001683840.1 conserved hypothetical protein [Leishmania major strain Friedlin]
MLSAPYRPRVVPLLASDGQQLMEKAADAAAGDFGTYPALQRPTSNVRNRIGGMGSSSADDPQTSPPRCGISWNRLHGASAYSSPLGHQYHADEVPPSSSVVEAVPSTAASRRYQQLAAQHLYGAAGSIPAAVSAPSSITPATSGSGAAVRSVPFSELRYTDSRGHPLPSAHESGCLLHGAKRGGGSGGPALDNPAVGSSGQRGAATEGCAEANELSAPSTSAMTAGEALRSSSVQGLGDVQSTSAVKQSASAWEASQLTPTQSRSSTATPSSNATVAVTADDRPHSRGSTTRRQLQRQLQRQRSRSFPSRIRAPATFTAGKHPPPPRTAHWAVKLIEDFVTQVAVQQESAATAPTIVPLYGAANALGRRATAGGRDATTTTTVADLTATFLSSRYGALQQRPILHEFAACLHRYRLLSPTCAVFREYFIHVDAENLADFHLFCRLYAAGDIQHCSTVETRRVALATATAASVHTIVSRRYIDEREVGDRLQRMLQSVVLMDCAPCIVVGADGGAASRAAPGDVTMSRQPRVRVQYRYAREPPTHTKWVPQRRHLTVDEIRRVKKAVLGWMEEAARKGTAECGCGAVGPYEAADTADDAWPEAAGGVDLQRVAFDREGGVDAYALLQATVEAVKLVCCSRHPAPERRDEDAGHVDGGVKRIEKASGRSQHLQQPYQPVKSTARSPQLPRELVSPPSQAYMYPLEEVSLSPPRPQHRSSVQRPTQPEGEDDGNAEARCMTQTRQEPSSMPSRTSVSTGVSAARVLADSLLLSPSCNNVVSQRCGSRSSSGRSHSLHLRPSAGQRTFSLSPCRRVAAKGRRSNSPASRVQQRGQNRGEREVEESRPPSSRGEPYTHHPYVTQLHGNQLWAEAQREAAAASQRRDSCWRDHYPRIYPRVQRTPSPRKPTNSACAAHAAFALSSSPVDATSDSIDAELRRRQARGRDGHLIEPRQMTASSVDLSSRACAAPEVLFLANTQEVRCGARPADGLQLPRSFSPVDPPASTVTYPSRIHPAAARSSSSAAPAARAIRADRSTTVSSSFPALSPRTMSSPTAAKVAVVSARPHVSHEEAAATASNAVLLTDEERAMLNQLEIALNRLDTQHQRNRVAIASTAAAGATAASKAYA